MDYEKYVDKKVVLTHNLSEPNADGNLAEEVEGTVMAVSGEMLMLKPKGKTNPILIELANVERIDFAPEKAKNLARKKLKIVQFGNARAHLLERHGYTLTEVNEITENEAFASHEDIDHEAADLGHVHVDKEKDEEKSEADED
ncbi:MAG TPA: hypothetical protein VIY48_18930 [Candidatus Paceibacterota bacterium]